MPLNSLSDPPADSPDARLERAVTLLRRRLEQNIHRQSQLTRLCVEWQHCWTDHYSLMSRHLATLESHLSAWMQQWNGQPRFTVVGLEAEQVCVDN